MGLGRAGGAGARSAVVVVALLAGALVAGGLVYARRAGTAAVGAAGLGVVVVVGLTTDRAGGTRGPRSRGGVDRTPLPRRCLAPHGSYRLGAVGAGSPLTGPVARDGARAGWRPLVECCMH